VAQARAQVETLVASFYAREKTVAFYVLDVEGKLFVCRENMEWRKTYEAGASNGN
jgi:hypothetical protein